MEVTQRTDTSKQPYVKPQLRPIELLTGEVLGDGCKNSGHAGPTDDGSCTFPSPCPTEAS